MLFNAFQPSQRQFCVDCDHTHGLFLFRFADGIILRKNAPPLLMEMKCPFKRKFENDTEVYSSYVHQVQMGMSCFDVCGAHYVQYNPPGHNGRPELLQIIEVERDYDWLTKYSPIIESFWKDVEHWRAVGWEKHPLAAKLRPKPQICAIVDNDEEMVIESNKSTCLIVDE
jgi:hypothetical protein